MRRMCLAHEQEGPIILDLGLVLLPAALLGWAARRVGARADQASR
jgi:hypothetical protein